MTPHAILFDLYGTLVAARERPFSRGLPAALRVPRAGWMSLLRARLLTTSYPDTAAFAAYVAGTLAPERGEEAVATCIALVEAECASVASMSGAKSLLAFLKRRGHKLGLVSNLASPFKGPVDTLGLAASFDAAVFSCDEGVSKPDPDIYQRALARLGVEPGQTLFVGDSLQNDVQAPAALGMRTVGIRVAGRDGVVASAAELGLLDLSTEPFTRLLGPGDTVSVGDVTGTVRSVVSTPDSEQGRYNLVFRVEVDDASGATHVLYAKRFLLPETVHVETFAYQLQALSGLPACTAALHRGAEDLLLVTSAPGQKWHQEVSEETAYDVGRHLVFALLFSNADIRPRNAFVDNGRVTLVDLEHCFFNLALDTSGLEAPGRPETFDRMSAEELTARTKKKVLSWRATSRARRSFFADTPQGSRIDEVYRMGFLDFYRHLQSQADVLTDALRTRIHAEPPLVIGTHGYRRALAEVDIADIRTRLAMDAEEACRVSW